MVKNRFKNKNRFTWAAALASLIFFAGAGIGAYYIYKTVVANNNNEQENKSVDLRGTDTTSKQKKSPTQKAKSLIKTSDSIARLGFWNVLNYDNKDEKARSYAFSQIIATSNIDLIALAEIKENPNANGTSIIEELNKLQQDAKWKELTTEVIGKKNQQERYTWLYKSSIFDLITPKNSKANNPYLISEYKTIKYARPVAAAFFKHKTSGKTISLATGHFDSPGASKNRNEKQNSKFKTQGDQEINEAKHLANVLKELNADNPTDAQIFMADTNIREDATNYAFKSSFEAGYKSLLETNEKTSLSQTFGRYASAYDKIFFKGNLPTLNANKFDLWTVFDTNIVDLKTYQELARKDRKKFASISYKNNKDKTRLVRSISDHTAVYFDIDFKSKK
ncbi:endonuclease/exonuclease/phosphatase family protein [Mesomycoplasma conjunctivae]|uniref:endonuclease/exonuclease/phosphatase family protein n=1 Tax=Mesomycoplasma conjunctivae TaxID=45361 RepID=UPI003DA5E3A1